jgi:hypothetical protein
MTKKSKHRKRHSSTDWKIIAGVGLLIALVFGIPMYETLRPKPGEVLAFEGQQHILYPETATYETRPPTSGPHYPQLARWGIHDEPIANELQVHNLEDGGVMVQYNCPTGCEELVTQLESVVSRYHENVILAPYPDMEARIALTAWRRLDTLETFDEQRIVNFIEAYKGRDNH